MINPDLFLAFCLASTALVLMPGPVVTLVVANSLKHGTRSGLYSVAGAGVGNAVLIVTAAAGVTTLMAVMADLFEIIRWAGAAYLIYLGIREWRASGALPAPSGHAPPPRAGRAVFLQGLLIGVTNPKAILFYLAFFPQFTDTALPAGPQLAAMCAAFIAIAILCDGGYALLAGRMRGFLSDVGRAKIRCRVTGALLIGTGLTLLLARK